ncbi:uncharacterized protein LOC143799997 [Ranitomeya variabilis]|uniref:uncharacterized protein LOC143799997 n=1 Tax=Ranitomeya variabilis TaxID=490064 RepID=UPI004055BAF1
MSGTDKTGIILVAFFISVIAVAIIVCIVRFIWVKVQACRRDAEVMEALRSDSEILPPSSGSSILSLLSRWQDLVAMPQNFDEPHFQLPTPLQYFNAEKFNLTAKEKEKERERKREIKRERESNRKRAREKVRQTLLAQSQ